MKLRLALITVALGASLFMTGCETPPVCAEDEYLTTVYEYHYGINPANQKYEYHYGPVNKCVNR